MHNSKIVMMFPGVGSQYENMVKKFLDDPKSKEILRISSEIINCNLIDFSGTDMSDSKVIQPLIITYSYIMYSRIKDIVPIDIFMGHSLGEITALTCADIIEFTDAIEFAYRRGEIYDKAINLGEVAIVLEISLEKLQDILNRVRELEYVEITAYNAPNQFLIAGTSSGIGQVGTLLKSSSAMFVPYSMLPMRKNIPVHCMLMQNVAHDLEFNSKINISNKTVISSVSGEKYTNEKQVRKNLSQQLYQPVKWSQVINKSFDLGGRIFIDSGPQRIQMDLLNEINPSIRETSYALDVQENMQKLLKVYCK